MRYIFIIISLIFLTACATTKPIPRTTNNLSAIQLFEAKKYKQSIKNFQHQNTPESQYYLAKAYLYGLGVKKDLDKAFKYGKLSADSNYPAGINLLGVLFDYGYGVEKDKLQALFYYKKAAKLGNTKAMMNIGAMYAVGTFVKQDANQSISWAKKAYENGSVEAIRVLGNLYGSNEVQNYKEAIKFYNLYLNHKDVDTVETSYIYKKLGGVYEDLDNKEQSVNYYKKSVDLNNTDAILHLIYMKNRERYIPKEEHLKIMKKGVKLNLKQAFLPLLIYYQDENDFNAIVNLTKQAYSNGNLNMGCYLAQSYNGLQFKDKTNLQKSYEIKMKIIEKNSLTKETVVCYDDLSDFYVSGNYLAKNIKKAIEIKKKIFNEVYSKKNGLFSQIIARLYLEQLHDYQNAEKWYKITYNITKDKSLLTKVDKFIKSLPNFKDTDLSKVKQKVYPIIDNFTRKEQIAAVLESEKYYFISIDQKSVNMYDKNTLELKRKFRGWIGNGLDGIVLQMAYDEHKELLYCAGFNSSVDLSKNNLIKVFNVGTGKIVNTIDNKNAIRSTYLNISKDGKYLVSINNDTQLNIINISDNKIQHYDFSNQVNFTHINIIKENGDYLVNALGNDKNLYTFSINQKRQISKKTFSNQTQFKTFNGNHAQGIFNNKQNSTTTINNILISNNQLYIKTNKLDSIKSFNLKNMTLTDTNERIHFKSKNTSNITIKYKNYKTSIEVYKNTNLLSNIEFYKTQVMKYKIINNKYIILVTTDGSALYIFNLQGRPIAKLKGFNALQTNMNYANGYLTTYGIDNIIHIWNIENLDKFNTIKERYDEDILHGMEKLLSGTILEMLDDPDEDLLKFSKLRSKQDNLPYTQTPQQFRSYIKMFCLKKEEIYPIASLYIKNNDWIIYNQKGYFASSRNGKNLIQYHLNQGLKKEAKIINNKQIFEKFYRPDIIRKLLAKEIVTDTLDIKQVLQDINPPSVNIISNKSKNTKNLELIYQVCDNGSGVSNTSILVNNVQKNIANTRGFSIEKVKPVDKCSIYKNIITLQSGKNTIAIKSFDKSKTISTTTKAIEVTGKFDPPKKSNLYFLSIAVANYRDEDLRLKYSVSDVNAVKEKIKLHSKGLFENIYTYDLHDSEVVRDKLDTIFDKIAKKISINDIFILYIAGHGVISVKDGLYYFLPYNITNTSSNGLINSAISVNNIKHQLGKISANKSLILLDTCDSGGAIAGLTSRGLEQRMALERLSYATGRNYIVASSKSQAALEGYKDHGVFTYSVLQAFSKAYFGSDQILTVTSLASFIEKTVPQITKEKFHYEQFPQKYLNGNDFPIGLKNN